MFMSPKELAAVLGVTPQCITAWCRAGYMHGDAHMVNGRWVIRWSDLLRKESPEIGFLKDDAQRAGEEAVRKMFGGGECAT